MIEDFPTVSSRAKGSSPKPPLPEGTTRGLCVLPSQPHHGWRVLRPLKPRRRFHSGRWHRVQRPASPSSDGMLFRRSNEHEPVTSTSMLSMRQHKDEIDSLSGRPLLWPSCGAGPCIWRRGSYWWISLPPNSRKREWLPPLGTRWSG
jgi:hypothetical protein